MNAFPPTILYPNAIISPEQFELIVMNKFKESFTNVEITHRENIKGMDGEFNIDLAVRFQELGVNFLVLVECKHHKNPIKRDYIQILNDRVKSIGAQKGILVASSSFQLGALEYASKHNIGLIKLINEEFIYERRSTELLNIIPDETSLSGSIVMHWIKPLSNSNLSTSLIKDFKELISDSME
ncbi:restriction endonuclease [Cohnella cholangitidis]|uniref:Restriction endonuclease n=1 Tax=Cohnella cholangitidis TaxID=2598458 RepID=A0A7G5BSY5_9BACL|nr:restriction endonuclease [Cohnella cholangitidis]QMV40069.1 restriction endonuclease [Cohnella cholangitidis]